MKYIFITQSTSVYEYLIEANSLNDAKEKFKDENYDRMIFQVNDNDDEKLMDIHEADSRDLLKWDDLMKIRNRGKKTNA